MNIVEKTIDDGAARSTSWLPEPDFSGSIYPETSRNCASAELIEWARALEDEKLRLQALVCHLLRENEQLRSRQLESGRVLIHAGRNSRTAEWPKAVDTTKKENRR